MANRRVIVKRRKAVRNIRKITRTMQLIATARFQAAMNRATASRPYVDKLAEMVADLSRVTGELSHPLMESHGGEGKAALVVVTSNRGLCGGYNANVLRAALEHLAAQERAGVATELHAVGKKGISALRFRGREPAHTITGIVDWTHACAGPAAADVAHCRINLASLHGFEAADAFTRAYGSVEHLAWHDVADAVSIGSSSTSVAWRFHDAGRTDITDASLRATLEEFLARGVSRVA